MGYHPRDMKDMEKEFDQDRKNKRHKFKTITLTILVITFFCVIMGYLINMNFVARTFGGDITINLQENQKLINVTWKNSSMWILTRQMRSDESAESYTFKEDSNFGILQGTVNLIESKRNR